MPLCSTEEAIAEIRQGKMIILVDDEDRENEGDLTMAAEFVTPEAINFMAKFGRGLICLPMSGEMADKLQLPLMAKHNGSRFGTNFTVSIEAREGITTGISAADRATTIKTAVADGARPDDLVTPGHVFPLRARPDGVLARAGQTEGSVDLARLAGLKPAAVICEIMKDDGTMARMPDLEVFAAEHGLKIASVRDLICYRSARYRNGFARSEFLQEGEIVCLKIRTTKLSNCFRKGHRIRVTVTSSAKNFIFPNSNTREGFASARTVVAHNRVYHGGLHASRLTVRVEP